MPMERNNLSSICYMPLAQAYLCESCHVVSNCAVTCPCCDNGNHLIPVSSLLNRLSKSTTSDVHITMRSEDTDVTYEHSSRWTHSICNTCWEAKNPDGRAACLNPSTIEKCCYCGKAHASGIYIHDSIENTQCASYAFPIPREGETECP